MLARALRLVLVLGLGAAATATAAERIAVAAAANLAFVIDALNAEFKRANPGAEVQVTTSASGNLFAQIKNGAPFDVFLSADVDYPKQIVAEQLGDSATLRTFATGRLVAWTLRSDLRLDDLAAAVRNPAVKKIALAQPRTAPYGRAAQAALEQLGVAAAAQPKLVVGESISQTMQFIETGNADLGFVALSVVRSPRLAHKGVFVEIPAAQHAGVSLGQAAVLTRRGTSNSAARRYLDFLATAPAKKILRDHGYAVPEGDR